MEEKVKKGTLGEVAAVFFKLGVFGFGGPAAHIAMMEEEVVRKRNWMSHQHFLDLMGATNLIPGPNSTEMTMHCGHERAGWKGLFVAGFSFIFPAVCLTLLLAFFYEKYGELPAAQPFIYGIKPAVIAIIIMAGYKLGKKALKSLELGILGVAALAACLFGTPEILALFACGFIGLTLYFLKKNSGAAHTFLPILTIGGAAKLTGIKLFLSFLKIGAILYGSGYVLFAFLEAELVETGYMTSEALLDSVAAGQFTPGPVLSTATFIGFQLDGLSGALLATLGIFLPSFLFVLILNPLIPKMRKSKAIRAFLDAVNIASVALIAAVCIQMCLEVFIVKGVTELLLDWRAVTIAVISLAVVLKFKKINSAFIVLGGSLLGWLLLFVG